MSPMRKMQLACCLALTFAVLGCNDTTKSNSTSSNASTVGPDPVTSVLPTGNWGGDNIQLDIVNNGGGVFTFDCGNGSTNGPIVPDQNAHFDIQGSYTAFADPNNPDVPPDGSSQNVIYHGDVTSTGDMIGLSVEFPNNDAPGGAPMDGFNVTHGAGSNLPDCI
jgi:hypothetical protein